MKIDLPWPVVLASGSPRRRELIGSLIDDYTVEIPQVEETLLCGESLESATQRLAQAKGREVASRRPGRLIIAADTLVGMGATVFGKPSNPQAAKEMLGSLSNQTHNVVTGVAIILDGRETVFAETTSVTFREIRENEIHDYVASGEPMDKAGGYAIQGGAAHFVKRVEGSMSNVIGLPLERLREELEEIRSIW